ncbi:Mei5p Ecym_8301 [Eremothecium cymbalariae DBVPG|uniref:Meiosis protein 5 n=1 Tax=Eremothecium cymbalariae (strain CBS 270.75 / DBVPG 7215 / KCTC 17166 / NRRL Y-17582) TaxID=931890 RepID=G8JXK5_ERECY|nr:Hypothetical protein Ecym_8301 [Eremothecium cymbalariae DBVPG\
MSCSERDPEVTLVEEGSAATPKSNNKGVNKTFKVPFRTTSDIKSPKNEFLNQGSQISSEIKQLESRIDSELREYNKKETLLKRAVKVASTYDQEENTRDLIVKWRGVCQGAMAYILNSTILKINKMGGYKEFKQKEVEKLKKQIEYQADDGIEEQINMVLESEDFLMLPSEEQQEIREQMEEKRLEAEKEKEKALARLEVQFGDNEQDEMTLQELAQRLKVEYNLVYPS